MRTRIDRSVWRKLTASVLAMAAGVFGAACHAATVDAYPEGQGEITLRLDGPIVPGDADKLSNLATQARASGLRVQTVALNSLGGEMSEALKLARTINVLQLGTLVRRQDECASACFFAFAAGRTRSASREGRLGVHGVTEGDRGETPSAKSVAVDLARVLGGLNVPAVIVGDMILTPPNHMKWLTPTEMRLMGIDIGP